MIYKATNKELLNGLDDLSAYFDANFLEYNADFVRGVKERLYMADRILAKFIFRKGEMFNMVEAWRNGRD